MLDGNLDVPPYDFFRITNCREIESEFLNLATGEISGVFTSDLFGETILADPRFSHIQELLCTGPEVPLFTMVYRADIPHEVLDPLREYLLGARERSSWGILRILDVRFVDIEFEDFQPFFDLGAMSIQRGWHDEYSLIEDDLDRLSCGEILPAPQPDAERTGE